jgi:transcriptional regulator with XRE-family HTH domain
MATASHKLPTHDELLAAELAADPEFAAEWERLAIARMLAVALIRYRSVHDLSQRALATKLGVSQPRIVELESGEKNPTFDTKNPTFDTIVKIAAATGLEFAIDIAPAGRAPQLVGKAVRDTPAHVYGGASVLVAALTPASPVAHRTQRRGEHAMTS